MKVLKKWMALLLTVVMTLAMGVSVLAAAQTGELTVRVNEGNTLKGQTIYLYRLFDLSVSGSGSTAKYAYEINTKYKDLLKEFLFADDPDADHKTNDDYYQAVADLENAAPVGEKTAIQDFADQFTSKALTDAALTAEVTSSKITDETDSYVFDQLKYGYYLVYQTGTKVLQSSLISVDAGKVEADLKGQAPKVEKTADKETVRIGEVITYTVEGTIPDTTGYPDYTYQIHDQLTKGLDFAADQDGTAITGTEFEVNVQSETGNAETLKATLAGDGNRKMTLDLSAWVKAHQGEIGKTFTVTYYARVNAEAVVATKNNAYLEYGSEQGDTTTSTPSEAATPTYPLSIKKTDTDGAVLKDAVFRLYEDVTEAAAGSDRAIKVIGQNGKYVVAADQEAGTDMDMTTSDSADQGYNLYLNGLAAGTYWLAEIQAPEGYNKLAAPVKVTITRNGQDDLEWIVEKDDQTEDDKVIDIQNTTGALLPGTGGMGTMIFTLIAALLFFGVAVSYVRSRRKVE